MSRRPSLRELERSCPANVSILPTAARRAVRQPQNRASRMERKAFREAQSITFTNRHPGQQKAEQQAKALRSADAGALLALAILGALDENTRGIVQQSLEALAPRIPKYKQASDLASMATLTAGQASLLLRALQALRMD
jgi:hypothetical protein